MNTDHPHPVPFRHPVPPRRRRALGCLVAACLFCPWSSSASAQTEDAPWRRGAFEASPEELRRGAAQPLPEALRDGGAPVVVLWRDESLRFDAEGKAQRYRHWIYRIDDAAALDAWGQSEVPWSPWFESLPRLRARVITAAGSEHWLAEDAVERQTVASRSSGIPPAEQRILRLPLPEVGVGALVEEELWIDEHRPPSLVARHGRLALALPVPVVAGRLRLLTPKGSQWIFKESLLADLKAQVRTTGEVVERLYEVGPLPAAVLPEPGLLPQDPRFPTVSFSSGESWGEVARALSARLSPWLAEAEGLVGAAPRRLDSDVGRIGELLTDLHRRLEVEEGSLALAVSTPRAPRKILAKGQSSGLEAALVLVAWLRTESIPAFVALVASGPRQDLDVEMPGEQLFDRPLVYVPAAEPVWIDVTDPWTRAGEIDAHLTGRWALVLANDSQQLVRLPWAQAEDHRTSVTMEVYLAEEGPARIVETNELTGFAARAQRRLLDGLDVEQREEAYLSYVHSAYHAPHLGKVDDTAPDDLVVPYRLQLEILGAERAFTAGDEAAVAVDLRDLVTSLSPELLTTPRGSRRGDYFFARPQQVERRYLIHLPSGMQPRELPPDIDQAVGSGRLRQQASYGNGLMDLRLGFHSGPIFLSARQFEDYRRAVSEILQQQAMVLWFDRPPGAGLPGAGLPGAGLPGAE